ncbi:hypothetical protein TNCV_2029001 [Trichonephila clavipes]|nr:hypothetical protein TNCV_2029001 [Trichonephila clavipes]
MGQSIAKIVRQLGISRSTVSRVYQEYVDGGQKKTSDRLNCKGQLNLLARGRRRSGVLYVASKAKHKLKLPPNGMTVPVELSVNGLCNDRFTVWISGAIDLLEYHCSMLVLPG